MKTDFLHVFTISEIVFTKIEVRRSGDYSASIQVRGISEEIIVRHWSEGIAVRD